MSCKFIVSLDLLNVFLLFGDTSLYIELLFLLLVLFIQIYFVVQYWKRMRNWASALSGNASVEEYSVSSGDYVWCVVSGQGDSKIGAKIETAINKYLTAHSGLPVSFGMLSSIVDREWTGEEEDIERGLSLPLYLGLVATMLGVVIALLTMSLGVDDSSDVLISFLQKIGIAVLVSLLGLVFTIFLYAVLFKKAREQALMGKNAYLSFLQSELLPKLFQADSSGFTSLSSSMTRLATSMQQYLNVLQTVHEQNVVNLQNQEELLRLIEERSMPRLNLSLMLTLEKLMPQFEQFAQYIEHLGAISENLKNFANRTEDVEKIVEHIDRTIGVMDEMQKLFQKPSVDLERYSMEVFNKMDKVDAEITKSVNIFSEKIKENIQGVENLRDEVSSSLLIATKEIENHLIKMSDLLQTKHLERLSHLPEIMETIKEMQKVGAEIRDLLTTMEHQPVSFTGTDHKRSSHPSANRNGGGNNSISHPQEQSEQDDEGMTIVQWIKLRLARIFNKKTRKEDT